MAKRLQTLEHLDGKQVQFSTITSQYPELFVQRKRNTGELIISTDTDMKYGMHHIYAGGEHIASGYGFATVKTRDDLTYIQETYTSTFQYFNTGYTYLSNAYSYLSNFVVNGYTYLSKSIIDNSFINTSVNTNNNTVKVDDITYVFNFDNGVLNIVPSADIYIKFNANASNTYCLPKNFVKKELEVTEVIYNNPNLTKIWYNPYFNDNNESSYCTFITVPIYMGKYATGKFYKFFTTDKQLNINGPINYQNTIISTTLNSYNWNYTSFTTYVNDQLKVQRENNSNSLNICIPIRYKVDTKINCYIYNAENDAKYSIDGSGGELSSTLTVKWVDEIMYGNTSFLNEESFTNNFSNLVIDVNQTYTYTFNPFNIVKNTYTYMLIPKNIKPKFYINTYNTHLTSYRSNNEGGMFLLNYKKDNITDEYVSQFINGTYNAYYNIYVSELHSLQSTTADIGKQLRYDIDFLK